MYPPRQLLKLTYVLQTLVTLFNFTIAMLDNAHFQKRAQDQLDAVLGPLQLPDGSVGHMPEFSDMERLPFITALIQETMRWMPVAPEVRLSLRSP